MSPSQAVAEPGLSLGLDKPKAPILCLPPFVSLPLTLSLPRNVPAFTPNSQRHVASWATEPSHCPELEPAHETSLSPLCPPQG